MSRESAVKENRGMGETEEEKQVPEQFFELPQEPSPKGLSQV